MSRCSAQVVFQRKSLLEPVRVVATRWSLKSNRPCYPKSQPSPFLCFFPGTESLSWKKNSGPSHHVTSHRSNRTTTHHTREPTVRAIGFKVTHGSVRTVNTPRCSPRFLFDLVWVSHVCTMYYINTYGTPYPLPAVTCAEEVHVWVHFRNVSIMKEFYNSAHYVSKCTLLNLVWIVCRD